MKIIQIRLLIYSFTLLISLFICLKVVFWWSQDLPISRLSIVYLTAILICLFLRNRISFFVLITLTVFPFVYKEINMHMSAYLFTEFSSVLKSLIGSGNRIFGIQMVSISYLIYFLILIAILIVPGVRKSYWNGTLKKDCL
ncbi:hypothetical protein D3C87_17520 [compost metagenome]